jgi:hypothetical protein
MECTELAHLSCNLRRQECLNDRAELTPTQRAVMRGGIVAPGGHPAAQSLIPSGAGAVDPLEQWQWDLSGYLLVKGVLPPDLVAAVLTSLPAFSMVLHCFSGLCCTV